MRLDPSRSVQTVMVLAAALIAGSAVRPAFAKIYKYRDRWGMTHVVDALSKVPPEYQNQVKVEEDAAPQPGFQLQQTSPPIVPGPKAGAAGPGGDAAALEAKRKRCERSTTEQTAKIAALRKKADEWIEEELQRNCGEASKTSDGGCYYISGRGGMREMLENLKREAEAKNPYRKQVKDEELRLKKIEGECR